ncbi:MAG: hypothetical protein JSW37_01310 [Anaerolineales bacterium]|nr:MAG: hypothetical protein JSW37_01310 [Anaerolineales bacterium]
MQVQVSLWRSRGGQGWRVLATNDINPVTASTAKTDGMSLQIGRRHPRCGNTQDDSEGIVVMTLKEPWPWVMVACVWTWASV